MSDAFTPPLKTEWLQDDIGQAVRDTSWERKYD